jgi:hypothetical protein
MAVHQVVSPSWIYQEYPAEIRALAAKIEDFIDDEVLDLGQDLTHTCKEFNDQAHCEECLDVLEKIQKNIYRALFAFFEEMK